MGLEDKNLGVLQNIEFAIVGVYKDYPGLRDTNVLKALLPLIAKYRALATGRDFQKPDNLEDLENMISKV